MLNTANIYIDLLNKIRESGGAVPPELIAEVEALDVTVNGDETTEPPTVGLVDIVGDMGDAVEDLDIDINGDDTTEPPTPGLKDRVGYLETTINGDPTTVPETPGLVDRVEDIETTINGDSSVTPVIPPLLASAGNMRIASLWTNADPSQAFDAGNITLSSNDYDMLLVLYYYNISGGSMSCIAPKGSNIRLCTLTGGSTGGAMTAARDITYSSDTLLLISDCLKAIGTAPGATDNNYVIPTAIYGIKLMFN